MLPYYGFVDEMGKESAYESGFLHRNTKPMHNCDWKIIYEEMKVFDIIKK